jgi:hypothetical protein
MLKARRGRAAEGTQNLPFSNFTELHQYSSQDWQIMSDAHKRASIKLGWTSKTYPEADRLGRAIMRCFDSGICDLDDLVTASVNSELEVYGLNRRKTDPQRQPDPPPHNSSTQHNSKPDHSSD